MKHGSGVLMTKSGERIVGTWMEDELIFKEMVVAEDGVKPAADEPVEEPASMSTSTCDITTQTFDE